MGICLGVTALQNRNKQTAVDQAGNKMAAVCRFHCFCQRNQAAVVVTIKLISTFQEVFFGLFYLADCNQEFRI